MHMVGQKNRINLASYMKITNKNGQNGGGGFLINKTLFYTAHITLHTTCTRCGIRQKYSGAEKTFPHTEKNHTAFRKNNIPSAFLHTLFISLRKPNRKSHSASQKPCCAWRKNYTASRKNSKARNLNSDASNLN